MSTTFCSNQFFRCVCVIKWLKNLVQLSCKFVKSCSSYFAQRFITWLHMKTWKLVLSIRYAYLKRHSPQLFQSDDTFGYSFDWWTTHLWTSPCLLDVPNWMSHERPQHVCLKCVNQRVTWQKGYIFDEALGLCTKYCLLHRGMQGDSKVGLWFH
jgi:hypothetical protein